MAVVENLQSPVVIWETCRPDFDGEVFASHGYSVYSHSTPAFEFSVDKTSLVTHVQVFVRHLSGDASYEVLIYDKNGENRPGRILGRSGVVEMPQVTVYSYQNFQTVVPIRARLQPGNYFLTIRSLSADGSAHWLIDQISEFDSLGTFQLKGSPKWEPSPDPIEVVSYFDDEIPSGASYMGINGDKWTWVIENPEPFSGTRAVQSGITVDKMHNTFFWNAPTKLQVNQGDVMFAHVYIDPENIPDQVMLQWYTGSWQHRAFWGEPKTQYDGTLGQPNLYQMSPVIPPVGQWFRLEVPASLVNLVGKEVSGLSFVLHGGRATWDYAGKIVSFDTHPPLEELRAPAFRILSSPTGGITATSQTAMAGIKIGGYGVHSRSMRIGVRYREGDRPFLRYKATQGVLEQVAIRQVRIDAYDRTYNQFFETYYDQHGSRYNGEELVSESEAIRLASLHYERAISNASKSLEESAD